MHSSATQTQTHTFTPRMPDHELNEQSYFFVRSGEKEEKERKKIESPKSEGEKKREKNKNLILYLKLLKTMECDLVIVRV